MNQVTKKQQQEIKRLVELSDKKIDTSDIDEVTNWSGSEAGRFYRPVKKQVTLRIDMDTIEWFKSDSDKYQTRMNLALREYMNEHR